MIQQQAAPVSAGTILAGKYRVDRVLGMGGMGVVVAATHLTLDQHVALKFMLPEALGNADAVDRFWREARNAARLKSEHVARILDFGTLETGSLYIVMEYLDGVDLGGYLQQHGRVTATFAADIIVQACEAVAEAHALGIIHRDLKPPNLFLTRGPDGHPLIKVLDFGIAKVATGDLQLTRTQTVMGSPGYMSPEQMRSARAADPRSDLWALGVILYQLVSGRVPFDAETFTELVVRVTMDPPPPLVLAPGDLPDGFEAVIRRCLEKDPAQRFQSVAELAVALAPHAPPRTGALVDKIVSILGGTPAATGSFVRPAVAITSSPSLGVPPARRRGVWIAALGAAVAVVAATVLALALRRGGDATAGPPHPPARAPVAAPVPPPPAPSPPVPAPAAQPPTAASAPVEHAAAPVEPGHATQPSGDRAADGSSLPIAGSSPQATAPNPAVRPSKQAARPPPSPPSPASPTSSATRPKSPVPDPLKSAD